MMWSPAPPARRLLAVAALLFAVGCTRFERTLADAPDAGAHLGAKGATAGGASPLPSAATPPPSVGEDEQGYPKSWSDPRVVAELAASCPFDVVAIDADEQVRKFGGQGIQGANGNPLECSYEVFEQTCDVPPPCGDVGEGCRQGCIKSCEACGPRCATACTACKAACNDDACRNGCGLDCAKCHDGCLSKRDRCVSGKCGPGEARAYRACIRSFKDSWAKYKCDHACEVQVACEEGCNARPLPHKDCREQCEPKGGHCELMYCGRL